ncbi:MAG: hypothetical protein MJ231_07020 [bacterium]|nr:hypothetical protein [bacterium]
MKINAIEMLSANSKMNLRARNEEPVPVENPAGNSENVMRALTLQGQNNMAFQGKASMLAKKGRSLAAALMLAVSAVGVSSLNTSCTKIEMFQYQDNEALVALMQQNLDEAKATREENAKFQALVLTLMNRMAGNQEEQTKLIEYSTKLLEQVANGQITMQEAIDLLNKQVGDIKDELISFHNDYKANSEKQAEESQKLYDYLAQIAKNGYMTNYQLSQLIKIDGGIYQLSLAQLKEIQGLKQEIKNTRADMNANFLSLMEELNVSQDDLLAILKDIDLSINATKEDVLKKLDEIEQIQIQCKTYQAKIARYVSCLPQLVTLGYINNAQNAQIINAIGKISSGEYNAEVLAELKNIVSILDGIKVDIGNLRADMNKNQTKIYNAIINGNLDTEKLAELIKENNDKADVMITQNNTIIEKIKAMGQSVATLEQIAMATGMDVADIKAYLKDLKIDVTVDDIDLSEVTDAIYKAIDAINIGNEYDKNLISIVKAGFATLEEIAEKTGMDVADIKAYLKDLKIDVSVDEIDLSEVINAINSLKKGNDDFAAKLMAMLDANFKDIEAILKDIKQQEKENGDILASQDAKLSLISAALEAFRAEVATYDAASLAKLDEILQTIKDKKCDCKGSEIVAKLEIIIKKINNHEGVIEDLEDLFN